MQPFRADLHCHSTFSDGSLSPEELVVLAKKRELQGLSITDHDSVASFSAALPYAKKEGVRLIPGAEFSTFHQGKSVHLLAYSFFPEHPAILALCKLHEKRRHNRNQAIIEKLAAKQMPLSYKEISEGKTFQTIGRPHIAQALIEKGYVSSIKEAFQLYIGDQKPCYVPGETIALETTIEIIHQAGGLAVLAHPHLIQDKDLVRSALTLPLDGIEAYYSLFPPQKEKRWHQIAKERSWIATGGSDFHGELKPQTPLGCSWVEENTFSILENHSENNFK